MRVVWVAALALGVVSMGCKSQGSGDTKESSAKMAAKEDPKASAATAPAENVGAGEADEEADVPTSEDFEEEVAEAITEKSDLGAELDALEKEIGD